MRMNRHARPDIHPPADHHEAADMRKRADVHVMPDDGQRANGNEVVHADVRREIHLGFENIAAPHDHIVTARDLGSEINEARAAVKQRRGVAPLFLRIAQGDEEDVVGSGDVAQRVANNCDAGVVAIEDRAAVVQKTLDRPVPAARGIAPALGQ